MSEQDNLTQLQLEDGTYQTRLTRNFLKRKPYEKQNPDIIKAVIPGLIDSIAKTVGAKVAQGETLMILEAMKMHNRIKAHRDGCIKSIHVAAGEKVSKGQVLLEIE